MRREGKEVEEVPRPEPEAQRGLLLSPAEGLLVTSLAAVLF